MDAVVKAKTGTGKNVAFLVHPTSFIFNTLHSVFFFLIYDVERKQLPAIETVLKAMSSNTSQRVPPIYVLILCPTRELANQVAAVAKVLLKYHDAIRVQTLVGGIRFKVDQKRLESDPCQVPCYI